MSTAAKQTLKNNLEGHKALITSLTNRVAVGGQLEDAYKAFNLWNEGTQNANANHRKTMMDLAQTTRDFEKCLEEYESINPNDMDQVNALVERVESIGHPEKEQEETENTIPVAKSDFQIRIAEQLGIPLNGEGVKDDLEFTYVGGKGVTKGLKCPITATFFVDPVKNSSCGHSYSKAAITEHLKHSLCCPVAGCGNKKVTTGQLEDDIELSILVRRHKRHENAAKERPNLSDHYDEDSS
jgi:hypothetical protein